MEVRPDTKRNAAIVQGLPGAQFRGHGGRNLSVWIEALSQFLVRRKAYCLTTSRIVGTTTKREGIRQLPVIMQKQELGRSAIAKKLESLTVRERQVLLSLANGRTNKELARNLRISPRTAQKHLQNIYAKLGVKGRTAAALLVMRWASQVTDHQTRDGSGP